MSWAEIKKAVNSNLSKPLDALITEKASDNEAILNNSTYGLSALKSIANTINTTVNKINTNGTGGKFPSVKSVQRGILKSTGSTFKYTININAINVNKSIIIVETALVTEGAADANSSASGTILSSTQIQIAVSNTPRSAFWQVVEFY